MSAAVTGAALAPPRWRVVTALTTIYLVWGSTYLAIALMVKTVPPLLGGGLRFVLAGSLMYAWVRLRGRGAPATRSELTAAALVGTLLVLGGNGLVTVAEREVPSGLAALLIASEPLWVIVLRRLAGERLPGGTLIGVVIGFAGVALLLAPGQRPAGVSIAGLLLCVLAAASWACGSYAGSRLALPRDPLRSTALQMLFGGLVTLVVAVPAGDLAALRPAEITATSLAAFGYLTLVGSIVAFTAYSWLLRNVPISTVSTYAYVNPVIAVALGWAILSEPVGAATLVGAAVIVASVASVMRQEGTGAGAVEGEPPALAVTEAVARPPAAARESARWDGG